MSRKLVNFSRNGISTKNLKLLLPGFWRYNDLHECFISKLQNTVKTF